MQGAVKSPQRHWSQGEEEEREWEPGDSEQHGKILSVPSATLTSNKMKALVPIRSASAVLLQPLYRGLVGALICFGGPYMRFDLLLCLAMFHIISWALYCHCFSMPGARLFLSHAGLWLISPSMLVYFNLEWGDIWFSSAIEEDQTLMEQGTAHHPNLHLPAFWLTALPRAL